MSLIESLEKPRHLQQWHTWLCSCPHNVAVALCMAATCSFWVVEACTTSLWPPASLFPELTERNTFYSQLPFIISYVDISPSTPEEQPVAYSSSMPGCLVPGIYSWPAQHDSCFPGAIRTCPSSASGTSICLVAQPRYLVPILIPCSLSPHSISMYFHFSLKHPLYGHIS